MIVRRFAVAVLAATLAVAACKGDPPPPPAPPGPDMDSLRRYEDSVRAAEEARRRAEAEEARRRAEEARQRAVAEAREVLEAMIFFDFDKAEIREDQMDLMRRKAEILRNSPQVQLRLAGHADERGSTEYNLALGNRRAAAVRDFFVAFGLPESRFSIISYGELRPLDPGHNEEAWAKNRRVEFEITAGANAINPVN